MTEFEKIYSAYFGDVFLYIRSLSGSADIAEEITSETFFKAMRAIDNFRGECSVRVWLCQIAKNCYYSYLKKHSRAEDFQNTDNLENIPDISDTPEESFVRQSEKMKIHEVLHSLNEPYKEVFTLRVFGELSFRQIGKLFGKTENWACVTYHRAKAKIREKLEDGSNEK